MERVADQRGEEPDTLRHRADVLDHEDHVVADLDVVETDERVDRVVREHVTGQRARLRELRAATDQDVVNGPIGRTRAIDATIELDDLVGEGRDPLGQIADLLGFLARATDQRVPHATPQRAADRRGDRHERELVHRRPLVAHEYPLRLHADAHRGAPDRMDLPVGLDAIHSRIHRQHLPIWACR